MTLREVAFTSWRSTLWLLALMVVACYILQHTAFAETYSFGRIDVIAFGALRIGPYLTVAAGCLAALAWWWSVARRSADSAVLLALIAVYFASLTPNAIGVAHMPTLLRQYSLVVSCLGFGLLAARLCGGAERILALLATVGAIGAAYGLYFYLCRIGVVVSGTVVRAGGLYAAPLEFACVLIACLPAAVYWSTRARGPLTMAAGVIACAMMLAALTLTFSRMALFAGALAAVFAVCRHAPSHRSAFSYAVAVVFITSAVIAFRIVGADNALSAAGSDRDHLAFIGLGIRAFAAHPLTGVGLGNLRWNTDGSNLFVQWLAEFGIAGGLMFVALIVAIIRCLRGHSALNTAVGAAFVGIALTGLTDVPFGVVSQPTSTCAVGLLLGAAMAIGAENRSRGLGVANERSVSAPAEAADVMDPDKIAAC